MPPPSLPDRIGFSDPAFFTGSAQPWLQDSTRNRSGRCSADLWWRLGTRQCILRRLGLMPILASPTLVLAAACDIQRLDLQDAWNPTSSSHAHISTVCLYSWLSSRHPMLRFTQIFSGLGWYVLSLVTDVFSDFIEIFFKLSLNSEFSCLSFLDCGDYRHELPYLA